MKAVSLIDEVKVTDDLVERVRTGEGLTIQDQVWVFMQAVAKFTEVFDAIPAEQRHVLNTQLVSDAIMMVMLAAPERERETLYQYLSGANDGTELDGAPEEEHDEAV